MAKLKTGRHTSAIKEFRKAVRRTSANRALKKKIRNLAKNVEIAITNKNSDEAKKILPECFSAWDKAAKVGLIHKNAASRKKAQLSYKISQVASKAA
ncbi:MAG: 30S ribosomal protein S20 [Elusimicrobia bacterium RIFCSPLOWO2_02_FULL_39_32]|nr:MAG: 30S ribosomal protein S20 [Elusimicrobia bacterium GWA2_38_7]OGR79537.1 MAG: 30S ribosomal protein S20 [Elusimicrobia bacterium RIFCSPHIGHO2_02_FULL_39_36]OGR92863.1 MAG: 30S ribosomal protein S20 [Elusimicrobia bacterium RIFCSPLOWO2_02_FULL_39_32]OGR99648.1 MAG: 30S ribosomal protein S20 [Elusimicrobia bacterium RIFCSPLOWO2_12_FULL_39_28]